MATALTESQQHHIRKATAPLERLRLHHKTPESQFIRKNANDYAKISARETLLMNPLLAWLAINS